jgi:N6-L-threonylcarbamoyladenine synthase
MHRPENYMLSSSEPVLLQRSMNNSPVYILGIESSCDETSAAVTRDEQVISNIIAGQDVHRAYGGVVPELASRAHQQQIVPVVHAALAEAGISKNELSAIAFTRGPGLIGSLLVGSSFAKSVALALQIPLIEINHMQAHVAGNFASRESVFTGKPEFPFLCLTVSGGHTQLIRVENHFDLILLGETMDDAAGEAFDKIAKLLGLPYPGGPELDKLAALGNPLAFTFPEPDLPGLNFSFSGLKTSILYFLQKNVQKNPAFREERMADICASVQYTIVNILMKKLEAAVRETGITSVALAGGVSANSGLRKAIKAMTERGWKVHIPDFEYCTDNAAMIALSGYYKYRAGIFAGLDTAPVARYPW